MQTPSPIGLASSAVSRVADVVAPRLDAVDSSVSLLREGYLFGSRRFARAQDDHFQTRLMLTPAVFTYGEEAARHFYEPDRLTRRRALPLPTLTLLQDLGSVQVLDGKDHRWRKQMFMSLMTPAALDEIADAFERSWRDRAEQWARQREVVLLDAVQEVLCRAVCEWSGVPLPREDVPERTRQFAAMFQGAGTFGPRNWWGQLLRHRAEQWVRELVEQVRSGSLTVDEGRALRVIASHRGLDGELLDTGVAAVELINVLRPTVAVGRFIVFAALALQEHPEIRSRVADDDSLRWFVQEVRRYYPFFPLVGGRAMEEFTWRGQRFPRGSWLLLVIYATNHDARIWGDPQVFRPERFRDWDGSPFDFLPQGGGDHATAHRCAGEWITIRLTERAVRLLTGAMAYEVPPQDLGIDLSTMPATPASGLVLQDVRLT